MSKKIKLNLSENYSPFKAIIYSSSFSLIITLVLRKVNNQGIRFENIFLPFFFWFNCAIIDISDLTRDLMAGIFVSFEFEAIAQVALVPVFLSSAKSIMLLSRELSIH